MNYGYIQSSNGYCRVLIPNCQLHFLIFLFGYLVKLSSPLRLLGCPNVFQTAQIFFKKIPKLSKAWMFFFPRLPRRVGFIILGYLIFFSNHDYIAKPRTLGFFHLLRKRWMLPRHTFWCCPLEALCPVLHILGPVLDTRCLLQAYYRPQMCIIGPKVLECSRVLGTLHSYIPF